MNNALKTFMIIAGLLQGTAVFGDNEIKINVGNTGPIELFEGTCNFEKIEKHNSGSCDHTEGKSLRLGMNKGELHEKSCTWTMTKEFVEEPGTGAGCGLFSYDPAKKTIKTN